jgi:kynurenine formamidase
MLAAACSAPAPPVSPATWPTGDIVDLSHAYNQQTVFWPTAESFKLEKVADGITPGGYYYAANNFCTSEHGGTHLDAPIHFAQGRQTVDQLPLDRLVGDAVVLDVSAEADKNADYQVTVDDFTRWEQAHGAIPSGAIVLVRTGFSRRWPEAAGYLGTAERGAAGAAKLHFPGLHPDAARWLVANRSIDAFGIDTASIDYGPSTLFESHREPDQSRSSAGNRCARRRAAHADRRGQRRPAARDRDPARRVAFAARRARSERRSQKRRERGDR